MKGALDYKGFRSTRFVGTLLVFSVASLFLGLGLLEAEHWVQVAVWSLGIYAGSEGVAKVAVAMKRDGSPYIPGG